MHQTNRFITNNLLKTILYTLNCCVATIILCVSLVSHAKANDAYAVFSLNNSFQTLSKNKVRMLYRGKIKRLQGIKVELSDWSENNTTRSDFYQILLSKDVAQMNAYWARLSFSGKARPPKVIKEDSMYILLRWLAEKNTRIGYAKLALVPKSANVLYIVKKEKQ